VAPPSIHTGFLLYVAGPSTQGVLGADDPPASEI